MLQKVHSNTTKVEVFEIIDWIIDDILEVLFRHTGNFGNVQGK